MTAPLVLRPKGVYLLTGGLGGIGMGMAEYLAQTLQAKLILTGRSGLPPRESWSDLLVKEGEESAVGQKILQVQALEAAGAEVLVIAADVADEQQMQAAVQQALARFGTIHGVLHMAGVPGMGLIQLKTAETAGSVLAPKVKGTLVLERVLSEIPLDFLVLFSSETSFTGGGLGQIDYCAANAFMDVYAQSQMGQSRRTISINWGEWQWNAWEEGMEGFGPEIEDYFRKTRAHYGVTFAEGQEALVRVLAQPLPQVVVSTRDFRKIMAWSNKVTIEQILSIAKEGQDARPKHPRPSLGTPYEAPRNELEETIAVVWGDVLGIDEIGIHDDFFDLGGHSLIATQVMTRLRQQYQAHLPLSLVLTAPTVAELAIAIEMIFIEELEALEENDELYNLDLV
jgi:NAD(P)-dependent dehydrogenase (short-subunit alcohol dehydrogenase family)/acyl carrier protein